MLLSAVLTMVMSSCTTPRPRLMATSAIAFARCEWDEVLSGRTCTGCIVLGNVVCMDHIPLSLSTRSNVRTPQGDILLRGGTYLRLLAKGTSVSKQPMSHHRTSLAELLPSWPKHL